MRMSVDPTDPGYVNYQPGTKVLFNEIERPCVFTADEEKGLIVVAQQGMNGGVLIDQFQGRVITETLYGNVTILPPSIEIGA